MNNTARRLATLTLKPGDRVVIEGRREVFTVEDASDPSLLTLRTESGATLKAGRQTVQRVEP